MGVTFKNILHLTETSEPGGSETVLAYIAKNLDPQRYRSLVCVLREGWLTEHLESLGVEYVVIENRRRYDLGFLRRLVSLIKRRNISLVHAHEFTMNVYGAIAAKISRIPMLGTIHGKGYIADERRRLQALNLSLRLCSRMIVVSRDLRNFIVETLKPRRADKLMVLYNGIDLAKYAPGHDCQRIRSALSLSDGAVVGATVGSLFPVKGLNHMLEAVRMVSVAEPSFKLIVAGDGGEETSLRQSAKSLGLDDTVKFLGFRGDVPELLAAADIYVCSSISEGLSLAILEAMATGKPIVATNVGGNRELVDDGETGFLVPPGNPVALAEKMMLLLKDKGLRESMGRGGRLKAEKYFSLEKMIENYQHLYAELLGETRC